jgi:uncharacterized protein (TIGR03663 family)
MTGPGRAGQNPGGSSLPGSSPAGAPAGARRFPWFAICIVLVVAVAVMFRTARLDVRPMHHDEANQALRFAHLLETGEYRYDASEHHGPTLYYLTLPSAWLRGQGTAASLDEWTLRLVPALFGVGTILLLLVLVPAIGRPAVAIAAGLLAVAPPLTYYSRFYIQESLLLFFSLGFLVSVGRYAVEGGSRWSLWAGAFAGFALATKETSIILLPAAAGSCLVARWWGRRASSRRAVGGDFAGRSGLDPGLRLEPDATSSHLWSAGLLAVAIVAVFYSSFFTNMSGLLEPFRAAAVYFERGVNPVAHRQDWGYYFRLLFGVDDRSIAGTDVGLVIAVLGAVGLAFRRAETPAATFWTRALLVYAVVVTAAYSALPYKTPWNALPFYATWLVLAAIGVAPAVGIWGSLTGRIAIPLAVVLICASLGRQSWRADFVYPADPRNPYAYVHTSPDIVRLARRVAALSALHPEHRMMLVAVVASPTDQWPLPWYLRGMGRVGYWTTPASASQALELAPVVIVAPEHAAAVQSMLGERYQSEYYGLRPNVLLSVFIERSLWDRFIASVR